MLSVSFAGCHIKPFMLRIIVPRNSALSGIYTGEKTLLAVAIASGGDLKRWRISIEVASLSKIACV